MKKWLSDTLWILGLLLTFALPSPTQATWTDITDDLELYMGRPRVDKKNEVITSDFFVTNLSSASLTGALRVVITDSNLSVSDDYGEPDGNTDDGEPYYDIVTDPDYVLLPGEDSPSVRLYFEYDRKRLTYEVRVEQDQPEPVPPVLPTQLDFGTVLVGGDEVLSFSVSNGGDTDLIVYAIHLDGYGFQLYPPLSFTLPPGGASHSVDVGFQPDIAGPYSGLVTIYSNEWTEEVTLSGSGEISSEPGDITSVTTLELGTLIEGQTVAKALTLGNTGEGLLTIAGTISDDPLVIAEPVLPYEFPFVIQPDEAKQLQVTLTAPTGSGGSSLDAELSIQSDDPDENPFRVLLHGDVISASLAALENLPVLAARVLNPDDLITAESCALVDGVVSFSPSVDASDSFQVSLIDGGGNLVASPFLETPIAGGPMGFGPLDVCALADGMQDLQVDYYRDSAWLGSYTGSAAVKHTSLLSAPVIEPIEPLTLFSVIGVCGSSRQQTTVSITGGANTVSTSLGLGETTFCLEVPLRTNQQNTLIVSALDDAAPEPKPTAAAAPIRVVQLDPAEIVIAEANARPLTEAEIDTLVSNGVLDLDDPENYQVSLFTIVLTIGAEPTSPSLTVSAPVAVPTPGNTSKTASVGGTFGDYNSGTGTLGRIVVIPAPDGGTIPGVILIDGRIKTLKELFQVTLALLNNSDSFLLDEVSAHIELPAGLTLISSGLGNELDEVPPPSEVAELETLALGEIAPGQTGLGQFILRGDSIGEYAVEIGYAGFITEGGLAAPVPFDGNASTGLQVYGPPEFGLMLRYPSRTDEEDVQTGEIYDLIVEVTNLSARPAYYTSLELFLGGDVRLVDEYDQPLEDSSKILSLGTIQPEQTVTAAFRIESLVAGEIIACQAIAAENITLTIDTGADGDACLIDNSFPVAFLPLPADMPPTVIGISPPNGAQNQPLSSSVFAVLTPQSACIVPDSFTNLHGDEDNELLLEWDLQNAGTFYLEELDAFDNPIQHIPMSLTLESPSGGYTSIAVLQPGLDELQYVLKPDTQYRATLVGGPSGICSAATGAEMPNSFRWSFVTEPMCDGVEPPVVSLVQPEDGSEDRPLNQQIVLDFNRRMDPASFIFKAGDLNTSSFGVYENAIEAAGELIDEGQAVAGTALFSNLQRRLTFTPAASLGAQSRVTVRLTSALQDLCAYPLQTSARDELLFSFETQEPDTTPPEAPLVNPVPALTSDNGIQLSGTAEAASIVTVSGGATEVTGTTGDSGLFSLYVDLLPDRTNSLQVQATDASGNESPWISVDLEGNTLEIMQDSTPPSLQSLEPSDGQTGVAQDVVIQIQFDEPLDPTSVNANNFELIGPALIEGNFSLDAEGTGFSFTPNEPLTVDTEYSLRLHAGGIKDLAGNGLAEEITSSFIVGTAVEPVIEVITPDSGYPGQTIDAQIQGSGLGGTEVNIDGSGVMLTDLGGDDDTRYLRLTIDPLATSGERIISLTSEGGSASIGFNVLAAPLPTLLSVAPRGAEPGQTLSVILSGSNLFAVTAVTSPTLGVSATINSISQDGTSISLSLAVAFDALRGITSLVAESPAGSASIPFVIDYPPVITGVEPAIGYIGQSLLVTFNGSFLSSAEAVISTNYGITGSILSTSDTSVQAQITITGTLEGQTEIGLRTVIGEATSAFEVITYDPDITLDDAVSRVVSVYQGKGDELLDAVSRAVSVFHSQLDETLYDSVSRSVSVFHGYIDGELRDAVSRAVSVLQ